MSIIHTNEELEQAPYTDVGKAECAYCDFVLTFPCLFWMTAKGQGIFAHHTCATRDVLRWAITHHYPQLALSTGVLRAGRESWPLCVRKASVDERIALLVRIEAWQRLEQEATA